MDVKRLAIVLQSDQIVVVKQLLAVLSLSANQNGQMQYSAGLLPFTNFSLFAVWFYLQYPAEYGDRKLWRAGLEGDMVIFNWVTGNFYSLVIRLV